MNWDDLRLVDAAARSMSLSAAASSLGLSQPQLSRRLRRFEETLGARLFDRTPQGLRPTRAGRKLIPLAAAMRDAADAVGRAAPDLPEAALSVVRLSVDEVRERFLTPRLPWLMARCAGVTFEIVSAHLHADHLRRETEIQLRSCLPETDQLIVRRVGAIAYAVFAAPALAEADQRDDPAAPWIGLAEDQLWYPEVGHWLSRNRQSRRDAARFNTMTGVQEAAAAGLGLAVLPAFMGDADPRLRRLSGPLEGVAGPENIIVHRDLLREPAVRAAVDALAALYRAEAATLAGAPYAGASPPAP